MNTNAIKTKLIYPFVKVPNGKALSGLTPREGSSEKFKKYVIFGHQRCGSSLLISALKAHPNIKSFSELFTPNYITFNNHGYDNYSLPLLKLRNKENSRFLENVIFNKQDKKCQAVGFKVFPDQIKATNFQDIWNRSRMGIAVNLFLKNWVQVINE